MKASKVVSMIQKKIDILGDRELYISLSYIKDGKTHYEIANGEFEIVQEGEGKALILMSNHNSLSREEEIEEQDD